MNNFSSVLFAMYPQARTYNSGTGIALDDNGNEVAYDLQAVTAQAQADAQTVIDTRTSALAKLAALGLTQDEVKALVG
jgi:hypothetical protein